MVDIIMAVSAIVFIAVAVYLMREGVDGFKNKWENR